MRVYIPKRCCIEDCGYLVGCIDVAHSLCCVTGLIPYSENIFRSCAPVSPLSCCTSGIIGTWKNYQDAVIPVRSTANHSCSTDHLLLFWRRDGKLFVAWNPNIIQPQHNDGTDEFVIILYDSVHFSNSVVVTESGQTDSADEMVLSHKSAILQAFLCHKQFCSTIEATKRSVPVIDFTCRETNIITHILSRVYKTAVCVVSLILTFCSIVCSCRLDMVTLTNTCCADMQSLWFILYLLHLSAKCID